MMNLPAPARLLAILIVAAATPVSAQTSTSGSKWQVDVYAGASTTSGGTDGTAISQCPAGTPIPTGGGTSFSRAVSSWYFGDGTKLFNDANTILQGSGRITALDPVLRSAIAERKDGAAFGVRISRSLTPRFGVEFTVDYAPASLRMTDEASAAIEASSASFGPAWLSLLGTGATANRNATSTTAISQGDGQEITLGGLLKIRLPGTARLLPYLAAGAGAVLSRGDLPSATLTGNYSFRFGGVFPMAERDLVTVRVQNKETNVVGLIGGGIEYHVAPRHGIRADVRAQIGGNGVDTVVSASPSVTTQTPSFVISTGLNPSVQFSNNAQLFNRPSSLSGPAVSDLRTFEGSGTRIVTAFTVGYFVRF